MSTVIECVLYLIGGWQIRQSTDLAVELAFANFAEKENIIMPFTVKIRDFSDEITTFRMRFPDLTGLNVFSLALDEANDLEAALAGAILGTVVSITYSQEAVTNPDVRPVSGEAQREKGLRLVYVDDVTGDRGGVTLGTADFGTLAQPGTDLIPLDHAEVAPIVAWMEANSESKAGNPITVESAKLVGRSN